MIEARSLTNRKGQAMPFDSELPLVPSKPTLDAFNKMFNIIMSKASYSPSFTVETTPSTVKVSIPLGCSCPLCVAASRCPYNVTSLPREEVLGLLRLARARLAIGWCQRTMANNSGGVCSFGALICAITGDMEPQDFSFTVESKANEVAKHLPGMSGAPELIRYNDTSGRTKAEVLALFDEGIARLESM